MASFKNSAKGARYIHLVGGGRVLVEAGATATVDEGKIVRLGPDIAKAKKGDLKDPPAGLVDQVQKAAPDNEDPRKALRAEYEQKLGKKPFSGWDADELKRRIAAA